MAGVLGVALASCYPWFGPETRVTAVGIGPYKGNQCRTMLTRSGTTTEEPGYAWSFLAYMCCETDGSPPPDVPLAVELPEGVEPCDGEVFAVTILDNSLGPGARWVNSSGIGKQSWVDVETWESPYEGTLYGTRIIGTIINEPVEGHTAQLKIDTTLMMGNAEACWADEPLYDTKVLHMISTNDPEVGMMYGYVCCPDEEPCVEWGG